MGCNWMDGGEDNVDTVDKVGDLTTLICLIGGQTMRRRTCCWRVRSLASSLLYFATLMAVGMLRVGWSCLTETTSLTRPFNLDSVLLILGVKPLVCHDYSSQPWRYCACNTSVSSSCCVFFPSRLTSCACQLWWWHCRPIITYNKRSFIISCKTSVQRHINSYDRSTKKCWKHSSFVIKWGTT